MIVVHAIGHVSRTMPNHGISVCNRYNDFIFASNGINLKFDFPNLVKKVALSLEEGTKAEVYYHDILCRICQNCWKICFDSNQLINPIDRLRRK